MNMTRRFETGMATLEAAIVLPLILFVFFAMVELGIAFAQFQVVQNAAREGARAAVLFRTDCTDQKVKDGVDAALERFSNTLGITTIGREELQFPVPPGTPPLPNGVARTACNAPLIQVNTMFVKPIPITSALSRLLKVEQPTITLRGSSTAATQQSRTAGS